MDKLEQFFTYISEQPKLANMEHIGQNRIRFGETVRINLQPLEQDCKDIFAEKVLALLKSNEYKGAIDMDNVMQMVYDDLLQQKVLIVCLMFSDGNKIYIEKTELCNILYFKNIFDNSNGNVFVELLLPDILDNYEMMKHVIHFIHNGTGQFAVFDADTLYKLALIDDYLGEIRYPKFIRGHFIKGNACQSNTFRTYLNDRTSFIWTEKYQHPTRYSKKCYNTVYDLCVILEQDMNCVKINDSIINYNTGFIGSKLHMNLCECEKKS